MNSRITGKFRKSFEKLPAEIREQARRAYRLFIENPHHPSLRFKSIHPTLPIYSVRVGLNYRAIGIQDGNVIIWFWIGSHADYDRLIRTF